MNSRANSLWDHYKDRRYGSLFFYTLAVVLGSFPAFWLVRVLSQEFFPEYADQIIGAVMGTFGLVVFWKFVMVCQATLDARRRWREKAKLSKLSSDELGKARSKLLKQRNRISL